MATLNPATPGQTATRRKELTLAFDTKVFQQLQRNGTAPVSLVSLLGPRSEILLGLKGSDSVRDAQVRIVRDFAQRYPLLCSSVAVDVTIPPVTE